MESQASMVKDVLRCWCRINPERTGTVQKLDRAGWRLLERKAVDEGVAGLIHRALSREPDLDVPDTTREVLQKIALEQAANYAWEEKNLRDLFVAFHAEGLDPILLRGHGLIVDLYESNGSLRGQQDHDLLVLEEEVAAARTVLLQAGFRKLRSGTNVYTRGVTYVDLHIDPYDRIRVPSRAMIIRSEARDVILRAVPGTLAGCEVKLPSAEDRLLLLSAHVVKHSFDKLIRLVDIAELLRTVPLDTAELYRHAEEGGTAEALHYTLAAVRALLDAPVPEELLQMTRPEPARHIERAFARVLNGRPSPFFAERLLLTRLPDHASRVRAMIELFWPPEEAARIKAQPPMRRLGAILSRLTRLGGEALASTAAQTFSRRI